MNDLLLCDCLGCTKRAEWQTGKGLANFCEEHRVYWEVLWRGKEWVNLKSLLGGRKCKMIWEMKNRKRM